ncbi:MAG TPA: 2-succinyl-5-enolpyruvyl-6-hydroxy-3-cyclohexene-1-carboxylic-acid synthase [Thermoanaerobaculia bacterium]|nr:2-succinyl-5-enolpyruvyl-6-hydroxy-3-cyclohexene-1-carboxylic-acid synthase [Thermoanaerobaculia bacterium]
MNVLAATHILRLAYDAGVRCVCVCAGSRNSPLLASLGGTRGVQIFSFADERGAAFFALGWSKRAGAPVAVITTSGTAVAEMLPAAIEAFYSGIPLMLITADRPARYRGSGAPQAIEQRGIFGPYAEPCIDLDVDAALALAALEWTQRRPLHINIAFDEPLIDGPVPDLLISEALPQNQRLPAVPADVEPLRRALETWRRPLVLLGGLTSRDRDAVRTFARQLGAPVYAEPLSGLRDDPAIAQILVRSGERMLARGGFDGVVRIGGVPALRFWRDLDETRYELPVVSVSPLPFPGLAPSTSDVQRHVIQGEISAILSAIEVPPRGRDDGFHDEDAAMAKRFAAILDDEPRSELAMVRALSRAIPRGSHIFLGNSLPIREWDLAAVREPRDFAFAANRGANGIDGEISTFFGLCDPNAANVCLAGDLTALYDLGAPWIVRQLDERVRFTIAVLNNGGGRIFSRVASLRALPAAVREGIIENSHALRFEGWASMWGLSYAALETVPDPLPAGDRGVLELLPDVAASKRVWDRYDAMWSSR